MVFNFINSKDRTEEYLKNQIEQLEKAIQYYEKLANIEASGPAEKYYLTKIVHIRHRELDYEIKLEEKLGVEEEVKSPPEFHLYYTERKLDFNLGQVDGFLNLDWEDKVELAELAAKYDLDLEETQTVADLYYRDDFDLEDTVPEEIPEYIQQIDFTSGLEGAAERNS